MRLRHRGAALDPAVSLQRSPNPLAGFNGRPEGTAGCTGERRRGGEGKQGKERERKGELGRVKKERIWTFYLAKRNPVDVRGKVQLHDE